MESCSDDYKKSVVMIIRIEESEPRTEIKVIYNLSLGM